MHLSPTEKMVKVRKSQSCEVIPHVGCGKYKIAKHVSQSRNNTQFYVQKVI
jgi:hypothetical protein